MKKRKLVKWLLLIGWMIVIFLFSQQPHSGEVTHGFLSRLLPMFKNGYILDVINFIIRKMAHFTEYFILGALFYLLLKEYWLNQKKIFVCCILFCFLYACTDEIHQTFVVGRTGVFRDCLIDTMGCCCFILFNQVCYRFKKN